MSGTKECLYCGNVNPADAKFCQGCGGLLPEMAQCIQFCAHCGASLDTTAKFCPCCGNQTGTTPTQTSVSVPIDTPVFVQPQSPKANKKKWWIIGISAVLLCGIIGGIISLIMENGALTKDVEVDDFIDAFENASYEMEYDYDVTLNDFEEEYGVSTGIDEFAAYTGIRTHRQNGWSVEEYISSFYYIKCDDEESAVIIFDALRDDEMYENDETVRNRDHSEKVRSEGEGDTYMYNGEVNYAKRCNIVSREKNVVVFVEVDIQDYYRYDINYNYMVDEVLEDVGF